MSWKSGHNMCLSLYEHDVTPHTLTLFHVELHYISQNYTGLRLSTRFAWQLLSSVSCCHGNKIPAFPSAPFTSLTLCQRERQQTHLQHPVCRFPGREAVKLAGSVSGWHFHSNLHVYRTKWFICLCLLVFMLSACVYISFNLNPYKTGWTQGIFFLWRCSPNAGHGLLIFEVPGSHTMTYHSR